MRNFSFHNLEKRIVHSHSVVNIYVLELQAGKYYVGKTNHTFQRFDQHVTGDGAKWTQKYPPIELYAFHPNMRDEDENKITLQIMNQFGVENVRGGSWVKVRMTKREVRSVERRYLRSRKMRTVVKKKKCTRCGRHSHSVKSCYARYHANGKQLNRKQDADDKEFEEFLKIFAARRREDAKEPVNEVSNDEAEAEINLLEDLKEAPEEERTDIIEVLSEQEEPGTFVGILQDMRKSFLGLVTGTHKSAKSILVKTKKRTLDTAVDKVNTAVNTAGKKVSDTGKKVSDRIRKSFSRK